MPRPGPKKGAAGKAWDRFVGGRGFGAGGFGTVGYGEEGQPPPGREIRKFPVRRGEPPFAVGRPAVTGDTQEDIIARAQQRDRENRRKSTTAGIKALQGGDDSQLLPIDLAARSSNPARPRALSAGYDSKAQTVRIRFRTQPRYPNGAVYEYYGVPRSVWKNLLRAKSPGRFITRVLDTYPYTRVDDDLRPTGMFQDLDL